MIMSIPPPVLLEPDVVECRSDSLRPAQRFCDPEPRAEGDVASSRPMEVISLDIFSIALSVPSYLSCSTLKKSW